MSKGVTKALWRLYLYILLVSALFFIAQSYFLWKSIIKVSKTELLYANKLVSASMHSQLSKNEALFKVANERLLELGIYKDNKQAIKFIDDLLANNPELVGASVVSPQGDVLFSSSNLNTENLPNLLEKEQTSKSFRKALKSDALVMGRTYFFKEFNDWLLPIKLRIRNKQNEAVAVFTTGLRISGKKSMWRHKKISDQLRISKINSDYYFLFGSFLDNQLATQELYEKPLSQDYLNYFSNTLKDQTGLTLDDFVQGDKLVVNIVYQGPTKEKLIAAFSYNSKYYFYTFTTKERAGLYIKLIAPMTWVLLLIIGFNAVLFFLFKHVSKLERESNKKLEYQAQHDPLTRLPNLIYLNKHIEQWKKQNGSAYSVIFMDLDDFKNSNDLYGHSIGDKILQEVAFRTQLFFKGCLCIRQGGDEFIIIAPESFTTDIEKTIHQFLQQLKKTIFVNHLEFSIRASIGVTSSPTDALEIDSLLRRADISMYEAKRIKSGVMVFSRKLDVDNSRTSMIGKELNRALERAEMSVVYQPQIDDKGKIIGAEALLRWNSELLGKVRPDEFIPIAESTGVILDIGRFVLETALAEFDTICCGSHSGGAVEGNDTKMKLSINLSVRQLVDSGFFDMLLAKINQFDFENATLMLEITETMTIDRLDEVRSTLEKIQLAGIEVSLDDFGTGYSSLSHLSKLPINEIKIDKSFISGLLTSQQDIAFVKSIINLGESLKVKVLAEGVETIDQLEILKEQGCKYFQGFYYSKPLSIKDLIVFIKNNTQNNR